MDFLKDYNKPYDTRILLQLVISLILSGALIGIENPFKLVLAILGIFFLIDMFLTRIDKIIKLLEFNK